jgi:VanZ family protein
VEDDLLNRTIAIRLAAWTCIFAIAALSLAPSETVVRTVVGGKVEHVAAYLITSFLMALAYGAGWRVIVSLLSYAAVLEFLQRFSPGRMSSVADYLFSAAGIGIGILVLVLLRKLAGRPRFQ